VREQRLVFGEDADLYDRARAGYSDAVIDDILNFAGYRPPGGRSLEVGAGTGKATVAFAARGIPILALEPSAAMAAVAARNCGPFPMVHIEVCGFEEWPLQREAFDLVFSAQAWHWVDPAVRWQKAAAALVGGGTLALLWHRTAWSDEEIRGQLDGIYRRWAPKLREVNPGFPGLSSAGLAESFRHLVEEMLADRLFEDPVERKHPWVATFNAQSFIELLLSQSDHRLLPEGQRQALFTAIEEVIVDRGGTVTVPHETWVIVARRNRVAVAPAIETEHDAH
jgi:SAM-dependent methyltransferase